VTAFCELVYLTVPFSQEGGTFLFFGGIMEEKNLAKFKDACTLYFNELSLKSLQIYGRHLQLQNPTAMKKSVLIKEIISVLCEEKIPFRNRRGAPIKNHYVEQEIIEKVAQFKKVFLNCESTKDELTPKEPPIVNQLSKNTDAVTCTIQISRLTETQKKLFTAFLESL
jgi:hypothetical protein